MGFTLLPLRICAACGRDVARIEASRTPPGQFVAVCEPDHGGCGRRIGFYPAAGAAVDAWNAMNSHDYPQIAAEAGT